MALDSKDWERIRKAWETDERTTFVWLPEFLKIKVSRQAIEKRCKAEGWKKGEKLRPAPAPKPRKRKPKKYPKVAPKVRKVALETDATYNATSDPLATKSDVAEKVINNSALTEFEQLFALEYLKDFNATDAARRAGFSGKNPRAFGYKTLQSPAVQVAIRDAVATRARAVGVDGDRLMQLWADTINADANEFAELRRIPCPWCYGKDGEPQMTIGRYYAEKKKHEQKRDRILAATNGETDIGEYPSVRMFEFIDPNKDPNPDCHVCHGMGEEIRVLHDTRKLSARSKILFCGVEESKGSMNIRTLDKEKAIDNLAKALFLFRDKDQEAEAESVRPEELTKRFSSTMERARRKQAAAYKERGFDESEVIDVWPEESDGEKDGEEGN